MVAEKDKKMGCFYVEMKLANSIDIALVQRSLIAYDEVRQVTISGLVDTGVSRLVIPAIVAEKLGARDVGEARVRYADNRTVRRKLVDDIQVELLRRTGTFRAVVEPDRTSVIIGAIVLEDLDLIVDFSNQTLVPRDPDMILTVVGGEN